MIFAVYLNYPEPERNSRLRPTDHHPRAERGGMAGMADETRALVSNGWLACNQKYYPVDSNFNWLPN